jgi:DNA-directed RNA polymerase specialized sigma subunit
MCNSKVSGIATTGNSTTRGGKRYNLASFASPSIEKDTDYVLAQVKNYAYYITSHNIDDQITADAITLLVKELPLLEHAAVFYRHGMDLPMTEVARRMHVSRSTATYHLQQAYKHLRDIIIANQ